MDSLQFSALPDLPKAILTRLQKTLGERALKRPSLPVSNSYCHQFDDADDFYNSALPLAYFSSLGNLSYSDWDDRLVDFCLRHEPRWSIPIGTEGCGYYDCLIICRDGSSSVWFDALCADQGILPQYRTSNSGKIHSYLTWSQASHNR